MPSLAEADAVMASEASSAAVIKTKRLIWVLSRRVVAIRHKFPSNGFVPADPKLNNPSDFGRRLPFIPASALVVTTLRAARSGIRRARSARAGRRRHAAPSSTAFVPVCGRRLWKAAGPAALQVPARRHLAASGLAAARLAADRQSSHSPARWSAGWCRSRSSPANCGAIECGCRDQHRRGQAPGRVAAYTSPPRTAASATRRQQR